MDLSAHIYMVFSERLLTVWWDVLEIFPNKFSIFRPVRGAKREISREGRGAPILRGLGEFFQIWPLIRAFSELFWGAPGLPGRGARPFWDARGGRPHPRPPPLFAPLPFSLL